MVVHLVILYLRILIVASAVFYYGEGRNRSNSQDPASLFDAHDLLSQYIGQGEWHVLRGWLLEVEGITV